MAKRRSNLKICRIAAAILVVAVLIHVPAMLYPDARSHSAVYNFIWTAQFAEAFRDGIFYPRWFPASFEGLGSPAFFFYPPLAFWMAGAFAAIGLTPLLAVACAGIIFSAASGLAMHSWLAPRTPYAATGAVIYMLAPYHLYDFYVRGALAEYAAFIWPPLILLAIDRLPNRNWILLLAISYGGLLITHIPSALLVTLFLALPYGIYQVWKDRSRLVPGVLGGTLGIGLACFYLVPALALQNHISTDLLWSDYYRPATWFPWNRTETSYLIGVPALALAYMLFGAGTRNVWGAIACVGAAASMGLVPLIWTIGPMAQVQFPWRLLASVEFAVITAILIGPRIGRLLKLGLVVAILPIVVFITMTVMTLRTPMDVGAVDADRPDAPEYLPPGIDKSGITGTERIANLAPFRHLPRGERIIVKTGGHTVIGHADFPIWQVVHDGKIIPHRGPLIQFDAPKLGIYIIKRKMMPSERIGWGISLLAGLAVLAIGFSRIIGRP